MTTSPGDWKFRRISFRIYRGPIEDELELDDEGAGELEDEELEEERDELDDEERLEEELEDFFLPPPPPPPAAGERSILNVFIDKELWGTPRPTQEKLGTGVQNGVRLRYSLGNSSPSFSSRAASFWRTASALSCQAGSCAQALSARR